MAVSDKFRTLGDVLGRAPEHLDKTRNAAPDRTKPAGPTNRRVETAASAEAARNP